VKEQSDFDQALSELTGPAWGSTVTTAQGRPVPATVLPWLRARELWIHAIDLQHGNGFSELPADFLDALITDVLTRRKNVHGELLCIHATDRREHPDSPPNLEASTPVMGRTADLARWLTGRGTAGVRTRDESPLPLLAPWL
jgi:maleylpyruvate isomerase